MRKVFIEFQSFNLIGYNMYVEVLRFRGTEPIDTVTIRLHEGMFNNRQLRVKTYPFFILIRNKKIVMPLPAGYKVGELIKIDGIDPVGRLTIRLHEGMIHHPLSIMKPSAFLELIRNKKIEFSKTEAIRAGEDGQRLGQLLRHRGTAMFLNELIHNTS